MSGEERTAESTGDAFSTEIPVRYADVDTYGHVNNAVYATFLEEARIDYLQAVLPGDDLTGRSDGEGSDDGTHGDDAESDDALGIVVANLEIDFRRPIETVDAVTVEVRVADVGTSSFTFAYEVRSPDGVHAEATTAMVAFDREKRQSRPLPDHWREAFAEFEGNEAE